MKAHALSLLLLLTCAFFPPVQEAYAQLEINSSGNAAVGGHDPSGTYPVWFYPRADLLVLEDTSSQSYRYGVVSYLSGGSATQQYAVQAHSGSGQTSFGLHARSLEATQENYGVYARASNTNGSPVNYGVYATAYGGSQNYAGYFDGDVAYTGTLSSLSDLKLKDDIQPLSNEKVLDRLMLLQPKSYRFRNEQYGDLRLPAGRHFGLVAQEVETVFPELVKGVIHTTFQDAEVPGTKRQNEYKGVNYLELIPLLLQALQEQQVLIQAQQARITDIEALLTK